MDELKVRATMSLILEMFKEKYLRRNVVFDTILVTISISFKLTTMPKKNAPFEVRLD